MKYNYDVNKECFVRTDGLGKKFHINIAEAQRIVTLHDLGNTVSEINNKIDFRSRKVSESTIKNFLNNVDEGNIVITGDYPVPVNDFKEFTVDEKVLALEERVNYLEKNVELLMNKDSKKLSEKLKLWLKQ